MITSWLLETNLWWNIKEANYPLVIPDEQNGERTLLSPSGTRDALRLSGSWIGSWKPDSTASAAITLSPTQGIPSDEAADDFEYQSIKEKIKTYCDYS